MFDVVEAPATFSRADHPQSALRPRARRAETGTPIHVLVVEDTQDVRKLMRLTLESAGAQVTAVGDGRSAALMIDDWPAPDLIVMDRMLPFLSGDELIRRVRDNPLWGKVPIVVVSAKARDTDVAE